MKARKTFIFFASSTFSLVIAQAAFAADGHGLPWGNFLLRVLNLVLFLGVIYYFSGKKIKNFLTSRGTTVVQTIENLEKKKAEAIQNLADLEKRIANVEQECAQILEEGRASAEQVAAAIMLDAEKQAHAILSQAHKSAEQVIQSEVAQIRARLADEVIAEVRKSLEQNLDYDKHQELINNSMKQVSNF